MKLKAGILLSTILLFGCSPKNPLLNQSAIDSLKDYFAFDSFTNPSLNDCKSYWAGLQKLPNNLTSKCDDLLKKEYEDVSKNNPSKLKGASLEQFTDPEFWKMFIGKKA